MCYLHVLLLRGSLKLSMIVPLLAPTNVQAQYKHTNLHGLTAPCKVIVNIWNNNALHGVSLVFVSS